MAFNPKSLSDHEQTFLVAENDRVTIGYKQIAGFLARRIRWYAEEGADLEQGGGEFGFIRDGSRVDLLLPAHCAVHVKLREVVKGGRSVIAEIT